MPAGRPRKGKKTAREEETKLVEVKKKVGEKHNGSAEWKSFYGHTKKQAMEQYERYMVGKQSQSEVADRGLLFETWARDWLENFKAGKVRDVTTDKTYRPCLELHILPYFGKAYLADITQQHVITFLKTKSTVSESLYNKIKTTLGQIFKAAQGNGKIIVNPTIGLPSRKDRKADRSAKDLDALADDDFTAKQAYTKEQARTLIDFAKGHKYGAGPILLLKTGMRRSELLALTWSRVDMDAQIIHVRLSVSETDAGPKFNPCKSKKSIRDIPFDDETKAVLESIPRATKRDKGKTVIVHLYVIAGRYGSFRPPHNWSNRIYKGFMDDFMEYCAEKKLDIPRLNPHELRHTFGSVLYSAGVDIVTISKLMGHSSIDTTVRLYVHDDMAVKQQAISHGV